MRFRCGAGGNILRVLRANEANAAALQAMEGVGENLTPFFNDSCRNFLNK